MENKEYQEYGGYIIAPGIQMPSYDIYEYEIFESMKQYEEGNPVHRSESESEAKQWVDGQVGQGKVTDVGAGDIPPIGSRLIRKYDGRMYEVVGIQTITIFGKTATFVKLNPKPDILGYINVRQVDDYYERIV